MQEIDARQQLMVITMEECGELIQECSKNDNYKPYNCEGIQEVGLKDLY